MNERPDGILGPLRASNPVSAEELRGELGADGMRLARERALAAGRANPPAEAEATARRRPLVVLAAVTAVTAVAVAVALVVSGGSGTGGSSPEPTTADLSGEYALTAIRAAERSPRLLVGADGWAVTDAVQRDVDEGEITFSDGHGQRIRVAWDPAAEFPQYSTDNPENDQWYSQDNPVCNGDGCRSFTRSSHPTVLGREGDLFEFLTVEPERGARVSSDLTLPPEDGTYLYISATNLPPGAFMPIVETLEEVDVETWLAALPPEIVKPIERPEVVDEMLRGVPLPPSVDIEGLKGQPAPSSRDQLAITVTGATACGWLDQWAAAVESGDDDARQEAIDAMATAHDWPALQDPDIKVWARTIWQYAHDMKVDNRAPLIGPGNVELGADGNYYQVRPYAAGLGCDSPRKLVSEGVQGPPKRQTPVSDEEVEEAIASASGGT